MTDKTDRVRAASLVVLSMAASSALAVIPQQEYDKYIDKHRTIQPMETAYFGEQINLRDGSLTFRVVDAELQGIGPPIRLVRTFRLRENNRFQETSGTTLAGWMVEVPRLKTITNYTGGSQTSSVYGWQVPDGDKNARCTNFAAPGPVIPGPDRYWDPHEWWSGYQLVDEFGDEQDVLAVVPGYPEVAGFKAVSSGNWRFSCLSSTANGELGEGFLATKPDGTRYWFNYLVYMPGDSMSKAIGDRWPAASKDEEEPQGAHSTSLVPVEDVLHRRHAMLLVTRVEDRFGNWLTYQYNGGSLLRIDASDGRVLEVGGTAPKTVSLGSATLKRTWSYTTGATYNTVTLPDGSAWTYNFSALTAVPMPSTATYMTGMCALNTTNSGGTVQGTATSPSGVTGIFTFALRRFGRSYVPKDCHDLDGDGEGYALRPADWFAYALTQRTFSGPGLTTQNWSYVYSPANASWAETCGSGCTAEVWTDITAPDGVRQRSIFSNRFNETENLLLREETYTSGNTLLRQIRHEYATYPANASSTPYAWPFYIGDDLQLRTNKAKSERWTPASRRDIEQDGKTFTWQVPSTCGSGSAPCFDKFARPLKVTKSSAP